MRLLFADAEMRPVGEQLTALTALGFSDMFSEDACFEHEVPLLQAAMVSPPVQKRIRGASQFQLIFDLQALDIAASNVFLEPLPTQGKPVLCFLQSSLMVKLPDVQACDSPDQDSALPLVLLLPLISSLHPHQLREWH
jgi:hypothetical protein